MSIKDLYKKIDCPVCFGDKVTFHRTYGTETKCTFCSGSGEITIKKAIDNGLY